MLVLLPPSEGKTAPAAGAPVDLAELAFAAELTEPRQKLLAALAGLARVPRKRAVAMLGVSPGQADEVAVDAELAGAPAAPAAEVYSGVLYDRLGLAELPAAAQEMVLISSALWGFVRVQDRIPYYRFAMKAKLDGIGALAGFWRESLAEALPDDEGKLIVDMRSGAYAAAWKPQRATLIAVRAFSESGGKRRPISHMAKAVRGDVARVLLTAKKAPADPESAATLAERAGFTVELSPGYLDVINPS
ncbi:MAG TPA: peroxide stress protein YaaA [Solirubrobacterales bacterium]|nr:peroxide stress protein YaaA [Solirubrobacterales bacterium]